MELGKTHRFENAETGRFVEHYFASAKGSYTEVVVSKGHCGFPFDSQYKRRLSKSDYNNLLRELGQLGFVRETDIPYTEQVEKSRGADMMDWFQEDLA